MAPELAPVIPIDIFPVVVPGIWNQNLGFLDLGGDRWFVVGKPGPKISGTTLMGVITDTAFKPVSDPRGFDTTLELVHDPRPFRYPGGNPGIMVAYESSKKALSPYPPTPGFRTRWQRTWGQAHAPFDVSTCRTTAPWTHWRGNPRTWGHKNFIPYAETTISHPGRGELWGWGDTEPSQFSPGLDIELRGGSLPLDLDDSPYALCAYHAVHPGPSGRKVYTAWLGFITKAWPHAVQSYWMLDTTYLLDLQPEVINGPMRFVESVVFPMALRRHHGHYECLMGVQDGATYGVAISDASIEARHAETVGSVPQR